MAFQNLSGANLIGGEELLLETYAVPGGTLYTLATRAKNIGLTGTAVEYVAALGAQYAAQFAINNALTTVGAGTLTGALLADGVITRSGPVAAYTDTTDTGALIITALQAKIGSATTGFSQRVLIKNTTPFSQTIAAGDGNVTLSGQTIIPPNSVGEFLLTMVSASTVTIQGLGIQGMTGVPGGAITGLTTNGAGTITAAGIVGRITSRTVPTVAFTDTTDTAVAIVAALPNANIGQSFEWTYENNTGVLATLAGGSGVTVTGTLVPANSWARYLVKLTSLTAVSITQIAGGRNVPLPAAKLTTLNATTGTLAAGLASGADRVTLISSNATPGSQAMRTPAQIIADNGLQVGAAWILRVLNTGAGTFTLATDSGSGFTMSGTMTVVQNVWTDFMITIDSATTGTVTNIGKGTYS